ncbi:class C sortase, partial [Inconstantimicrobium porci]|uniref:class C sortase n=1 Tax=Inconstantimicrobium porci TaxID=2652291 RepID=UPI0024093F8C
MIPKIKVSLPIYHGVNDDDLAKGAGHLKETALPIGGCGNHSVLCAHRGLPTAKLFTDLDKLNKGDKFYINILNERHTYIVDDISVVEPGDTTKLHPVKGKDYITLLTCTPYGINSHRLLVRGIRGQDEKITDDKVYKNITSETTLGVPLKICAIIIAIIVIAVCIFVVIMNKKKKLHKYK